MSWYYEEAGPMGGAGGDAYKSVFNGIGQNPAETLAREAVQNSVDAAVRPEGRVRIEFKFAHSEGADRDRFFEHSGLADMVERHDKLGLISSNCLAQANEPIELLYVEDYLTTGLEGDPTSLKSNLRKLLMDLGGSYKNRPYGAEGHRHSVDGRRTGGSYGFGKAAYSSNSKVGVIFAFSKTHDENGVPITLLMGAAYQAEHEIDEKIFTGRAWLGERIDVPNDKPRFDPFIGEEAERRAELLGFKVDRGVGTSILIVDTAIDPSELVAGLEHNWWPRLIDNKLEVEVVASDGSRLHPKPKRRQHLKPFIDAWGVASAKDPQESMERKQLVFRQKTIQDSEERKVGIGKLGLVSLQEAENDCPLGEEFDELVNTVALVRSPGMVVCYQRTGRSRSAFANVVGCFIADNDIDGILRLSEPPPHNEWDPTAQRLINASEAYPEVVDSVLKRVKKGLKDFQKSASPPDPLGTRRLTSVERVLAQWFGPSRPHSPGPDKQAAPISLIPIGPTLEMTEKGLVAVGGLKVRLADGELTENLEELPVHLELVLKVSEEDGVSSSDPVPFKVTSAKGDLEKLNAEKERRCVWRGLIRRGAPIQIKFRSAPYDPSWTIQMVPLVTEAKEGEGNQR